MDLSACTEGQRATVTTLDAPLMVSAGAGSGKTFTLTQRIVGALLPRDGEPPFLGSVEEVLAITFTKKAAAELRARIKATLRAEGLGDQALLVDDAWISTIHSMAARILRENALELGIDPTFQMLSEAEGAALLRQAADAVAERLDDSHDPYVRELLAERGLLGSGFATGAMDDALAVRERAQALPGGLKAIAAFEPSASPAELLRQMVELGEAFATEVATWEKVSKNEATHVDAIEGALEGAREWLEGPQARLGFLDAAFDAARFARVLYAFPATTALFASKRPSAAFFEEYRSEYLRISDEAEAGAGLRPARALAAIAAMVEGELAALKGPSRMDSADLLRACLEGLRAHPGIAERYRRRFRLIMVDEFQDTDKVQVEVIAALAAPGLANVCVVGDAQQSIYRFRGADVNVFLDYERALREDPRARFPQLASNFRSHGDVLAAVERVFSQPRAFGKGFLRLEARGKVNELPDPVFDALPRIELDVVQYRRGSAKAPGVAKPVAIELSARHVAARFAALREAGADPRGMALLLGSMGNAAVYQRALREVGLESMMVAGSVFSDAPEPQVVGALLRCAANPRDEEALMGVLLSPLLSVGDDVLLALAYGCGEDGHPRHRSFARAFARDDAAEGAGLSAGDREALAFAQSTLRRFVREARSGSPVRALRRLLARSGALDRQQEGGAEGLAQAGNYAKALHLVEGLERQAPGIATLASAYHESLAASKQTPGVLATPGAGFVRIMTIHGSKGLQFDHVVVAETKGGSWRAGSVLAENEGESAFVLAPALMGKPQREARRKLKGIVPPPEDEPCAPSVARTAGELLRALEAFGREQEMAEAQRLLYVAMTRAVRSLQVAWVTSSSVERRYEGAGVLADMFEAFEWDDAERTGVTMRDFGGSAPARIAVTTLTAETAEELLAAAAPFDARGHGAPAGCGAEGARDEAASVSIPVREEPSMPVLLPWSSGRQDVRSYTSLEHSFVPGEGGAPAEGGAAGMAESTAAAAVIEEGMPEAGEGAVAREEPDDATALGTAFHRLAQRAIVAAAGSPGRWELARPGEAEVAAQERQGDLSGHQRQRLRDALQRWFGSDLAARLGACESVAAEVPFMVMVEGDGSKGPLYLEGEIDALGDEGAGCALLVDYKTGGLPDEGAERLHAKHLQQAQCYAYALLRQGFDQVEACFVRVEQPDGAHAGQPQVVPYRFERGDLSALEEAIYGAYV